MALSEKWVLEKARALLWNPRYTGFNPVAFTRAIEAEVRKDDEALIRKLVDALDTAFHQTCSVGRPKDWEQIRNALHSARARLEEKPCA